MFKTMPHLSTVISGCSSAIPFIAGITFFRFYQKDMRLLTIFFGISVLFDAFLCYTSLRGVNNVWAIHIWTVIEYGFLIYVFSYWHEKSKVRKLFRRSIPVFIAIWFAAKLFGIENMAHFENYTRSIGCVILTIVAITTLYNLSESAGSSILGSYRFWISLAVLIYFAGNIIVFSVSNTVLARSLFFIHDLLNINANLLYAGGFLCLRLQSKHGGSSS